MDGFEIVEHGDLCCSEVLSQDLDRSISEISSPGGVVDEASTEDGPVRDIFRRAEEPRFPYQFLYEDVGLSDLLSGELHGERGRVPRSPSHRADHEYGRVSEQLEQRRARLQDLINQSIRHCPVGFFDVRHTVFGAQRDKATKFFNDEFTIQKNVRDPHKKWIIVAGHFAENEILDHIHVLHLCRGGSGNYCRCFNAGGIYHGIRAQFGHFRVSNRKPGTAEYIENALRYLVSSRGRAILYAALGTGGRRNVSGIACEEEEGLLVEKLHNIHLSCGSDYAQQDDGATASTSTADQKAAPRSNAKSLDEAVEELILKSWCCDLPILKTMLPEFYRRKIRFSKDFGKNVFPDILEKIVMETLRPKTLWELEEMISRSSAIFNAENNVKHYQSLERSTELLGAVLSYQVGSQPLRFLKAVEEWFNFKGYDGQGKMNTIWFYGDSDCGKTAFCELLCQIALVVARPEEAKPGASFPWNDCIMARLLFLDEGRWNKEQNNNVKKFMSGEQFHTNKKYESNQCFRKVPVLLCTNDDPFMWGFQFFRTRVMKFTWTPLPEYIRTQFKFGHMLPLAFFELYRRLSVNEWYARECLEMFRTAHDEACIQSHMQYN